MDAQERQQTEGDLLARAAELKRQGQTLALAISQSAARIADTEDEVARIHDTIARSGVSACANHAHEHAERARRYAQHERQQQQRWLREAHNDLERR